MTRRASPASIAGAALAVGATLSLALTAPESSRATFPGLDGPIVFTSDRAGDEDIYVMGPDGSAPTRLTHATGDDDAPALSADGKKIVFVSQRLGGQRDIYVMNADGSNEARLTSHGAADTRPAFSPDGSRIVFDSTRDGGGAPEVYAMNANGSNQVRLTANIGTGDYEAVFSPKGDRIAFTSTRDGGDSDVFTMDTTGANVLNVTDNDVIGDWGASFSPNGKRIAFASNREGPDWDVWTTGADGNDLQQVTSNFADQHQPAYSPTGGQIAYTTDISGDSEIAVLGADGQGVPTSLTVNDDEDLEADWGRVLLQGVPVPPTPPAPPPPRPPIQSPPIQSPSEQTQPLTVKLAAKKRQPASRVRARVSCSAACDLRLRGRGRLAGQRIRTRRVSRSLESAGTTTIRLGLTRSASRRLDGRRTKLRLRATASATTGQTAIAARTIRVRG